MFDPVLKSLSAQQLQSIDSLLAAVKAHFIGQLGRLPTDPEDQALDASMAAIKARATEAKMVALQQVQAQAQARFNARQLDLDSVKRRLEPDLDAEREEGSAAAGAQAEGRSVKARLSVEVDKEVSNPGPVMNLPVPRGRRSGPARRTSG
ncbi:hypothetical protein FOA52_000486 [Chlamydomonas sp. UWO 241]|nr:hypothetical protein FOA52_000486 [Chlamydomonas sp. UWO 241]